MFVIVTLSFALMKVAPGGPFAREKKVSAVVMENLNKKYHLDEPVLNQYLRYLGQLLQGDLGVSFKYESRTINQIIEQSLPVSMLLGVLSLLLASVLGVVSGMISALRQNKWPDYLVMSFAVIGISVPLFVIGPVLQLVFAIWLKWFPLNQWFFNHGPKAIVLPMLTLSFPYFAYIARLARASLLEVLRSDYIRTARAKGLKESVVIFKHGLKGAMLPVVSYLAPAFAGIVIGALVVEKTFAIPGMGEYFVMAAINRDYTLIMAEVVVYSALLLLANLIVDLMYGLLDPRIAYK
jgi:oligopeptide transport system permease protein